MSNVPLLSRSGRELQADPRGVPTGHLALNLSRTYEGITAQKEATHIPRVEAFRKPVITADQHAGHGNID